MISSNEKFEIALRIVRDTITSTHVSRTTSFLFCIALICVYLNWLRFGSMSTLHSDVPVVSTKIGQNSNRTSHILSAAEAEKLVNLAAARLSKKKSDLEDAARLELQDELPFTPYWELDDDERRLARDGPIVDEFKYELYSGRVFSGKSQCASTRRAQSKRFDRAFADYVKLHADMIAGRVPAKFVHAGLLHKSSLQNNIKVCCV
jgi:hypothetical protein